jgi:hypothetical protein
MKEITTMRSLTRIFARRPSPRRLALPSVDHRLQRGGRVRLEALEALAARWLACHSIALLRISLGLIFLAFGLLKFFPGHSPAAVLAERTLGVFTFGVLPPEIDRVLFPHGLTAPTLEAQYVLKDAVLLCASLVVAARALGGRLVVGTTVPMLAHSTESTPRRAS